MDQFLPSDAILAIAAGADFEHLTLPRYWPDRSMSLNKGVSHRDFLAKYAVAYFEYIGRWVWQTRDRAACDR